MAPNYLYSLIEALFVYPALREGREVGFGLNEQMFSVCPTLFNNCPLPYYPTFHQVLDGVPSSST